MSIFVFILIPNQSKTSGFIIADHSNMKNKTAEALERYRQKLASLSPLSEDNFMQLANVMHETHFSKGEVLLREGQVCREYFFIIKGCIRSFGLEDGKEVNVKFYFEDDTVCDYESFRWEKPSEFYFVAMEDTIALSATKADAVPVWASDSGLNMLLFRFFQDLFMKEEEHSNTFKLLSPEERYRFLLENRPQYLTRIPLVYLASYMGVSRETLTRIRQRAT